MIDELNEILKELGLYEERYANIVCPLYFSSQNI